MQSCITDDRFTFYEEFTFRIDQMATRCDNGITWFQCKMIRKTCRYLYGQSETNLAIVMHGWYISKRIHSFRSKENDLKEGILKKDNIKFSCSIPSKNYCICTWIIISYFSTFYIKELLLCLNFCEIF